MDATVKRRWVEALRSGEYPQAKGWLRSNGLSGLGFCCLGVLCDLRSPTGWEEENGSFMGEHDFPPPVVATWAGLNFEQQKVVAEMNDNGKSFAEIADYIEKKL